MIVAYWTTDEVLVCEKKNEKYMLKHWFAKVSERNIEEYEREESEDILAISTRMRVEQG